MREQSEGSRWDRDTRGRKCEVDPQAVKKRSKKRYLLERERKVREKEGDGRYIIRCAAIREITIRSRSPQRGKSISIEGYSLVSAHR